MAGDGVPKPLASHGIRLDGLVGAGKAAADQRKAARRVRAEHGFTVEEWKEDVNALRLSTFGALLAIAAKSRRPRAWAEGFFAKADDSGEGIDVETDASATPLDEGGGPIDA